MSKSWSILLLLWLLSAPARAQSGADAAAPTQDVHEHPSGASSWMWMNDGVLFVTFNDQGSARGSIELTSQNWLMTMGSHDLGRGQITLKGMFSAEPLTVTSRGYSELFQMGEAYNNLENIDRQHPHNMFMQLAAGWRVPLGDSTAFTISGGPVGEATLGPAAFMHRPSSAENPVAPLSHHELDSTHIAEGVVAGRVDQGPFAVEGSLFHGREPDQYRYNIETGKLDSWAARVWFQPSQSWQAQVSYGFLKEPEQLEPGDVRRTTASLSWMRGSSSDYVAATLAVGHNARIYNTHLTGVLSEATLHRGKNSAYTRIEILQVATEHLLFPLVVHKPHPGELIDWMGAYTAGLVRDIVRPGPLEIGAGIDTTVYNVPTRLVPNYGTPQASLHVFLRIRPRPGAMGHMWNMTMPSPPMPMGGR